MRGCTVGIRRCHRAVKPGLSPSTKDPRVRAVMKGNRRRDTSPELRLRSLLHARGLRFRVDYPIVVPGRAVRVDVVFPRPMLAVFMDGCYWHGCDRHPRPSKSNLDYWTAKIDGNRARDVAQTEALKGAGWRVLRAWEHDPPTDIADRIVAALASIRRRDDEVEEVAKRDS